MSTLEFAGQLIEVDVERTRAAYAMAGQSGCEECGCGNCLRFLEHRASIHPSGFLAILESLGISFDKEAEVFAIGPSEDGKWLHEGWFHFYGVESSVSGNLGKFEQPGFKFKAWMHTAYRPKLTALTTATCVLVFNCWV